MYDWNKEGKWDDTNVIPFQPRNKTGKAESGTKNGDDYAQLLEIEETIEQLEIKIARKEKWIKSGLLKQKRELLDRYMMELDELKKERVLAEKNRKNVIMKLMKQDQGAKSIR